MKRTITTLAAVLAVAATATTAAAQDMGGSRAFRIGLQAGVSLPLGSLGDEDEGAAETGFNVGASLGVRPMAWPVGFQFDLGYNRFGVDTQGLPGVDANWNILAGSANIVAEVPTQTGVRPYFIGGVGYYNYEAKFSGDADGDDFDFSFDDSDIGLNAGAGLRFGLGTMAAKVEARYHTVFAEEKITFLPISFGIEF